jgi:hypothetical protein
MYNSWQYAANRNCKCGHGIIQRTKNKVLNNDTEVLMAVTVKSAVVWGVTPCSLVDEVHGRFGETSVNISQIRPKVLRN